jgi:hypothetical protein
MKNIIITIVLLVLFVGPIFGQVNPNFEFNNKVREEVGGVKKIKKFQNDDLKKTVHLKYIHQDYKKANISNSTKNYYLRYNLFTDEMEYVNNGNIYNLNKSENKIIDFFEIKTKYVIFELDDKLNYYVIKSTGKSAVLIKQNVRFDKGKKAITQFDIKVTPKFYRKKDDIYIAFKNKDLKIIPRSKKAFYKLFNNKAKQIKKYMSQQKLSHKKLNDIIKITNYFNSII